METVLDIQLDFVYAYRPASVDWISNLATAESVNEDAENFLVNFEWASSETKSSGSKILYYKPKLGLMFQEAVSRRNYAQAFYEKFKGTN